MVDRDSEEKESRPATLEDLARLCAALNERGARYVIIGGTAMLNLGFIRATEDIDLLIPKGKQEEAKVIAALSTLPDGAASEIQPGEIERYEVIRVADEIIVDVMSRAGGVEFQEAENLILWRELNGVPIPFASAELMLKLKQSPREKDVIDRRFIEQLLKRKK